MTDLIETEGVGGERSIALVTGASEGFGRELTRLLAADGFDPIVEWFQNDPADTARTIWKHAKRRRKNFVADTAFVRLQAAVTHPSFSIPKRQTGDTR